MQIILVEKEALLLVGLDFFGDPFAFSGGWTDDNEISRLWKRFMQALDERYPHLQPASGVMYEVHVHHPETQKTGESEVFVGVDLPALEAAPVGLVVKALPACTYAVLQLQGAEITGDWWSGLIEWLPDSGYDFAHEYSIQWYDSRFKGLDQIEASALDIYVPVRLSTVAPADA